MAVPWERNENIYFYPAAGISFRTCAMYQWSWASNGKMILGNILFSSRSKLLSKSLLRSTRIHLCTRTTLQWLEQYPGPAPFPVGSHTPSLDSKKRRSCLPLNVERKYVGSFGTWWRKKHFLYTLLKMWKCSVVRGNPKSLHTASHVRCENWIETFPLFPREKWWNQLLHSRAQILQCLQVLLDLLSNKNQTILRGHIRTG